MRNSTNLITVFSAKDATGTGSIIDVSDYQKILIEVGTATSANLTVKFQGSISDTAPTFSGAQTVANHWDYIDVIDLEDGASIDGDTGVSCSGTDDFRLFQVNCDGLKWFCATVTARSAGSVTVKVRGFSEN